MKPADYDAWYDTPRGRWIGETEYALAARMLTAQPDDSLLDVGCGKGHKMARPLKLRVEHARYCTAGAYVKLFTLNDRPG